MTVEVESKLIDMMKEHFKDDSNSFARIDKAFEKQTEIAKQNAEHFSYFNKTLVEIRKTLDKDAEETAKFREFVTAHTVRVEPIIKAFEEEKIIKANNDRMGENVVKWSTRIGAIGFIGSVIIYILRKTL